MAMATTRQTEQVAPKWFPHPNQEMRNQLLNQITALPILLCA